MEIVIATTVTQTIVGFRPLDMISFLRKEVLD
jgi:hypothetical protein